MALASKLWGAPSAVDRVANIKNFAACDSGRNSSVFERSHPQRQRRRSYRGTPQRPCAVGARRHHYPRVDPALNDGSDAEGGFARRLTTGSGLGPLAHLCHARNRDLADLS